MRPVFVGNFDYDTRQTDLDRLFSKYGRVDRIDIKSGTHELFLGSQTSTQNLLLKDTFLLEGINDQINAGYAFVYFEDERDAEDAINGLDNIPFGYSRRRLSVEWSKQGERGPKGRDGSRSGTNTRPTKTLFVINFDPIRTRVRDIERHFEPYGKILNVRIRRNFAFVQFETQEEATKALESTNMTKILDRVVSVEYAFRDDDDHGDMNGSPRRGGYGRRDASPYGRSDSPDYRRGRPSPDYGRPRSPVYDRYGGYDRRSRSPEYDRYRSRSPVRRSRT